MSNLNEVCFFCISKQECEEPLKKEYKENLRDIFQNERNKFNYEIKTFKIKSNIFHTDISTIKLYRKLFDEEVQTNNSDKNKDAENNKDKEKIDFNRKLNFCSLNKEKLYSNISFSDSIGKFLDNSTYFIKYISAKEINSAKGKANVIQIARCGFNMEYILKELGYEENKDKKTNLGFYYQYKYYPIIGIYQILKDSKYIYLQVKGFYTEINKDEILEKLNEIENKLKDLFIIKYNE